MAETETTSNSLEDELFGHPRGYIFVLPLSCGKDFHFMA